MKSDHLWYVRRKGEAKGPYPSAILEKYITLGRVVAGDEISVDGAHWQPADGYPDFEILQRSRQSASAAGRLDERASERRQAGAGVAAGQRQGSDRRAPEEPRVLERRRRSRRIWRGLRSTPGTSRWTPFVLAAALLASILLAAIIMSPAPRGPVDCGARPGPGVNWEFCNRAAADLRGAVLRGATLRNARLAGADLTGADLREADLAYADLSGALLPDADLSGARLVGAIGRAASFNRARLIGTDFEFADLVAAVFDGAVTTGARFDQAIMPSGITCDAALAGSCDPGR